MFKQAKTVEELLDHLLKNNQEYLGFSSSFKIVLKEIISLKSEVQDLKHHSCYYEKYHG